MRNSDAILVREAIDPQRNNVFRNFGHFVWPAMGDRKASCVEQFEAKPPEWHRCHILQKLHATQHSCKAIKQRQRRIDTLIEKQITSLIDCAHPRGIVETRSTFSDPCSNAPEEYQRSTIHRQSDCKCLDSGKMKVNM